MVAIVDTQDEKVVEYLYDAWGRLLETSGTKAADLGLHNPLRYRGYVYDTESGLYYLQSRYYNPELGRFINADSVDYLGAGNNLISYNLFVYCGNNPVMGYDPLGRGSMSEKSAVKTIRSAYKNRPGSQEPGR